MKEIARKYDDITARLYVVVTLEMLAFDVSLSGVIFYFLGFSSFALLQAIGLTLLLLVTGSVMLQIRKKGIKKRIYEELLAAGTGEAEFVEFLKETTVEFEFIRAMYIPVSGVKKPTPEP